jgi:hypothetical protein
VLADALFITTCLIVTGAISLGAFENAARRCGWKCVYWFVSSLTTAAGMAGVLGLLAISDEAESNLSGGMSFEFMLAVALIYIGVLLSLAGFIVCAFSLWASRRAK